MTAQEEKFRTPSHLTKWQWIAPGVSWSGWRTTPLNSLQESLRFVPISHKVLRLGRHLARLPPLIRSHSLSRSSNQSAKGLRELDTCTNSPTCNLLNKDWLFALVGISISN